MIKGIQILVLCWLLAINYSFAQTPGISTIHFDYITTKEGLSQNSVDDIIQDSQGYMWFATWNGLCRYDGYLFETFKKDSLSYGMQSNLVRTLYEDENHRLWIGTSNGIAIYNIVTREFEDFNIEGIDLTYESINSIFIDGKNIYFATDNNGLIILKENGKNYFNLYAHYQINSTTIFSNSVTNISTHNNKYLMIGTRQGSYLINRQSCAVENPNNWSTATRRFDILVTFTDSHGVIWIGSRYGLHQFNPDFTYHNSRHRSANNLRTIPHNSIYDITEDNNQQLIIGTLGGICFYNRDNDDFSRINGDVQTHNNLNNDFVNSLYTDSKGNVWIGTEKGGINYYNTYQTHFSAITFNPENKNTLSNPTVNSVFKENDHLWIGTAGGGLNLLDEKTKKIKHFKHQVNNRQSLNIDFITSINKDSEGKIWVATWGGGVAKMLSKQGQFKNFSRNADDLNTISSDYVSTIYYDHRGFFVLGEEGGFDLIDPKTERTVQINEKLRNKKITEIGTILNDGTNYWIGSRKGLFKFAANKLNRNYSSLTDDDIEVFKSELHNNSSLPNDFVTTLIQANDKTIWGGTYGGGIFKIEEDSTGNIIFRSYNQNDGLQNNVIYRIEEDDLGYLWLSTDNGLTRFNKESEIFTSYYENDGLLSNQFYWSASFKDENGIIFFGGLNGLNYFDPRNINAYPFENEVFLTDVKIYHESVKPFANIDKIQVLNQPLNDIDTITLSYKHNVFSLEFSSLDYYLPDKIHYEYKLDKIDNDWVQVNYQRRVAAYTNLKGDVYNFQLRCTNSDGSISSQQKNITIIIKPPFWQKNWFQILVLISVIAIVFLLIRYQMLNLITQKNKLKIQVDERTKKIEEQKQELYKQAESLKENNLKLEQRQSLIEGQKQKLEEANVEISKQRDQLIELNAQIEEVSQSKLRFFTNISHEFRTPLTLILDPIQNLLQNIDAESSTAKTLNMVQRNAQRLLTLVNQLMYFRRIENGQFTIKVAEGDLTKFIEEIFNSFIDLASNQKILFEYHKPVSSQKVYFDPEKIENVLYNLLSNAFKFTHSGGKISIRLEYFESDKMQWTRIVVKDSGIGIEKDQIERIFDRFYQIESTKNNSYQGSGIGLALSKGIVEAYNGNININSESNQGSEFIIELPCDKSSFTDDQISEAKIGTINESLLHQVNAISTMIQEPQNAEKKKIENQDRNLPLILIVEDNFDLRNFLVFSFQNSYRVLEAANGKIGLELANKHTPDLIISDVMMPEMDGIELCSRVKSNIQTSHIPIILLTAKALVENWVEGLEIGADDYIPKPFNFTVLNARIKNLIENRKKIIKQFSNELCPDVERVSTSTLDEEFLEKTYNILEQHYSNADFSVEDFAQEMCISKSLLYKKLKALTGMSITDFINSYKIKKSLPMLKEGRLNVADVAFKVGYNDPKYFSRVFRKFMGMAPSSFS